MLNVVETQVVNGTHPDLYRLHEVFAIKTNASQVVLGAVLTQEYKIKGKKIFMPVLYASRSLKGAKRRYSVTDLEALAVVWAVKTFRLYIKGTQFKVLTDHNALKALLSKASLEGWLACWADFLMGFNFEIITVEVRKMLLPTH